MKIQVIRIVLRICLKAMLDGTLARDAARERNRERILGELIRGSSKPRGNSHSVRQDRHRLLGEKPGEQAGGAKI